MNSFNFAAKGIEREVRRQIEIYESGGQVEQETLHFGSESAPPLRSKEEAQDYRYFPEPDLVPLEPNRDLVERLRTKLPEAPAARIRRLDRRSASTGRGVTSGRDELYSRIPGERGAVANVVMNELAATGVDPASVNAEELAKVIERRTEIPRLAFTEALAASGSPDFSADRYLAEAAIADVSELDPVIERILSENESQARPIAAERRGCSASSSER